MIKYAKGIQVKMRGRGGREREKERKDRPSKEAQ